MRLQVIRTVAVALVVGIADPAAAYIGPGAGLSVIGAFWGLFMAVFAALAFIVSWLIRRLLRRRSACADTSSTAQEPPPA
jgi:membrane protein implicated in regulation of membrane protease activity